MADLGSVLGLVGSPNRDGRTFRMVTAALDGASRAGAQVELVQMADHLVEACRDCLPWECKDTRKCAFSDPGFEYLSAKLLRCGAVVLGTPIYWWDTSAMVRQLILKMFRVHARSAPLAGVPALGIGVAGGTGNGLVSGLRPVYHFFQMLQMRPLEPLPVTRFNWAAGLELACELGAKLAGLASSRQPFTGVEDRLLWYDGLPYLNLSRAAERRLLASVVASALPATAEPSLFHDLAKADALAARGDLMRSLQVITRVYETGVKLFETGQS
jgi:NAD(P)H-dependent FMN reductase